MLRIALVIGRYPHPAGFENEALGEQQDHSPFDVFARALAALSPEPPLGDALDGILGLWIVFQVAKDLLRDVPCFGGIRLFVHSAPSSAISPSRPRTTIIEGKSDATHVEAWNRLISQAAV